MELEKFLAKGQQVRSPTLPLETTLKGPLFTSHKRGYAGLKLGDANIVFVSFQIIGCLLFHAIWRMMRKTKGADRA
jgi:hypothetical protein